MILGLHGHVHPLPNTVQSSCIIKLGFGLFAISLSFNLDIWKRHQCRLWRSWTSGSISPYSDWRRFSFYTDLRLTQMEQHEAETMNQLFCTGHESPSLHMDQESFSCLLWLNWAVSFVTLRGKIYSNHTFVYAGTRWHFSSHALSSFCFMLHNSSTLWNGSNCVHRQNL